MDLLATKKAPMLFFLKNLTVILVVCHILDFHTRRHLLVAVNQNVFCGVRLDRGALPAEPVLLSLS